jgi:hypothetical protein
MQAGRFLLRMVFGNHFYGADDVFIEPRRLVRWYPVFLVNRTVHGVPFVSAKKCGAHAESCDVSAARTGILRFPIARDLRCVLFV